VSRSAPQVPLRVAGSDDTHAMQPWHHPYGWTHFRSSHPPATGTKRTSHVARCATADPRYAVLSAGCGHAIAAKGNPSSCDRWNAPHLFPAESLRVDPHVPWSGADTSSPSSRSRSSGAVSAEGKKQRNQKFFHGFLQSLPQCGAGASDDALATAPWTASLFRSIHPSTSDAEEHRSVASGARLSCSLQFHVVLRTP